MVAPMADKRGRTIYAESQPIDSEPATMNSLIDSGRNQREKVCKTLFNAVNNGLQRKQLKFDRDHNW